MGNRQAILILLVICNIGLALGLATSRNEIRSLRGDVTLLRQQLELKRSDPRPAKVSSSSETLPAPAALPTSPPMIEHSVTVTENGEASMLRSADWKAQFYLSEVEKFVALTPQQQASLRDRYAAAFASTDAKAPRSYREILKETLGEEIASQLEVAQRADAAKRDAEELSDEVFSLSRKLALTNEQEASVTAVLKQLREELRPLDAQVQVAMREAMSNHSGANPDKERLRLSYDQLKELTREMKTAKDAALSQRLRELLTDQQYNALLELQASAAERF